MRGTGEKLWKVGEPWDVFKVLWENNRQHLKNGRKAFPQFSSLIPFLPHFSVPPPPSFPPFAL